MTDIQRLTTCRRGAKLGLLVFIVLLASMGTALASAPRYRIIDLGSVGKDQAYSMSNVRLNILGHVILFLPTGKRDGHHQPIVHAFLWKSGKRFDLGVLPGYSSMVAADLNDQDAVVGWASKPLVGPYGQMLSSRAFLWRNGKLTDIGRSAVILNEATEGDSFGDAINDQGTVAGSFSAWVPGLPGDGRTTSFLFLYHDGRWTSAGHGDASRMNLRGDIAGTLPSARHALLFSHGRKRDLGTLSHRGKSAEANLESDARGLNSHDTVVGSSETDVIGHDTDNISHAFLWRRGKMYDLDKGREHQESGANAVNDHGLVAGYFMQRQSECACLWKMGRRYDLNGMLPVRSGWHLRIATDINDQGEIVGHGYYRGSEHAFLLMRRDSALNRL